MNKEDTEAQSQFDRELVAYASGTLDDSHIFNLGKPGVILAECGFPPDVRIELEASRLRMKATQGNHPFDFMDIKGLDKALQSPVAVFEYGDRTKAQNVIVDIEKDNKNFLVGVHFNQMQRGYRVSDIRGLFNRDNIDWIRWICYGKMIYGNKKEIQVLAAQQRTNLAEVSGKVIRRPSDEHYLDSVNNILQSFGNVNDVFTKNYPMYTINQKAQYAIYREFFDAYKATEDIDIEYAAIDAHRFYEALKANDKKVIREFIYGELPISDAAKRIYEMGKVQSRSSSKTATEQMAKIASTLSEGEVYYFNNKTLGKIKIKRGNGKRGFVHIIKRRLEEKLCAKDSNTSEYRAECEVAALLYLCVANVTNDKANVYQSKRGTWNIEDGGIRAVIGKDENENFVLTGFELNIAKKEATESINTVIDLYGNTPEFLAIYAQIGAVASALMIERVTAKQPVTVNRIREAEYVNPPSSSIPQPQNKSSNQKCFTAKKDSKAHKHNKKHNQSRGR